MNRFTLRLAFAILASNTALGDLVPPVRTLQPVIDPSMVVIDRGSKLEILPTKRASPVVDSATRAVMHHVTVVASSSTPIGPFQLGVVFNHALQQQGYITGEIAFKVKSGRTFSGSTALYPGLKRIVAPSVYVVYARTPAEFIAVLKRLQVRSDLDWVEPTVTYGPAD